ncbi:MAG: DUF2905 domain-containing protein [bacterium]|nr:DUF2905 domain-containing protein [bacterium]
MDARALAKIIIVSGILLVVFGSALYYSDKIPFLGRLPGDIRIKKESFSFYFPVATCILLSIILSFILWLIHRK